MAKLEGFFKHLNSRMEQKSALYFRRPRCVSGQHSGDLFESVRKKMLGKSKRFFAVVLALMFTHSRVFRRAVCDFKSPAFCYDTEH